MYVCTCIHVCRETDSKAALCSIAWRPGESQLKFPPCIPEIQSVHNQCLEYTTKTPSLHTCHSNHTTCTQKEGIKGGCAWIPVEFSIKTDNSHTAFLQDSSDRNRKLSPTPWFTAGSYRHSNLIKHAFSQQ